ncbi:unnamed protein product [Cyclocybe aegerita]|uniref:Elongator complex protein 1 n=1 Tax=Cyclocybe aegerita TaxID=1973307 RepID=A0A8S0VTJ4_CYCAE|nr:unnamed protein product [Cyclocybe aegerita]
MRNLTLISSWEVHIPAGDLTATTYDLDENIIYVSTECSNPDGEVEVELWRIEQSENRNVLPTNPQKAASFRTVASSNGPSDVQTISLRVVAETRKIASIMRGGDVITVSMDEEDAPFEVEGTFETGILAASWSPDESSVSIVTGEHKLILLTSMFDVLSECPLYVDSFGEDAPINVGWGSKQTQFHGSLGKAAAQAPTTVKASISPDDDHLPRISWRGDGAFFVVSSLSPEGIPDSQPRRTLRVYDRQGVLQSTSEEVAGLEHTLVWRPSGNLIVGTQRFGFEGGSAGREGRHDVVFFERNGLRHGEFSLKVDQLSVKGKEPKVGSEKRWGYKVREMAWNADSNVLAVWIEGDDGDVVQFWTTGNYHWYLKHEIAAPSSSEPGRFTSLNWHPELALHLILTTSTHTLQRVYSWDTFVSPSMPPNDSGAVAVFDGSSILLTPFRSQNVPPPMSSFQLSVSPEPSSSWFCPTSTTPIYAAFAAEDDTLGILWEHGYVELWSLRMKLLPGPGKIMEPSKTWAGSIGAETDVRFRQLDVKAVGSTYVLTALGFRQEKSRDVLSTVTISEGSVYQSSSIELPYRNSRLLTPSILNTYQAPSGEIYDYSEEQQIATPTARFPEFCVRVHKIEVPTPDTESTTSLPLYLGLAKSGKLYASRSDDETRTASNNATSFAIASSFVIFTTTTHEATFAPIVSLPKLFEQAEGATKEVSADWPVRKVERGSRIVVAVPSSMSLVLQMPRGNLETINPRPLVMEVVKQDLDAGNYRKAFFACRKHRIDLNVIVDHNPEKFVVDIPSFVDQIPEVDHLNLMLTLIGRGTHPQEFIASLCNAFRDELEKRDLTKYVNSILTAHVVKTPPDHEAGLALLLRLRDSDPDVVEEAVKYIIFLVDADRLFDTALGMYDFSLVIMIAQHAQKDPREYLPFLRDLRALGKYYQRFRIDDHLKRHESALRNLSLAGHERFEEAVAYVERHRLYDVALGIWKGNEQYEEVLNSYGDYLYERREFRQAASVFMEAKRINKAMMAHEKALQWQELFDLAVLDDDTDEDDIVAMGYRVAEELASKKRYGEAARVLLDYSKDIREAVIALVQGNLFSEARRIIRLNVIPELLEEVIHPASLESRAQIAEDIGEMGEQIRKQVGRIRELRVKKVEEPDAFYGLEDNAALHNVDVMTDVSMPATAFTRFTVAPTTASRSSRRTSRSKRKMERKVGSGRKGTVDEEEYLLRSVSKLVDRFITTQGEARNLLPHLFQFTEKHREEGLALQREVGEFEIELKAAVEEIWVRPEEESEAAVPEGWAARIAETEKAKLANPLDKVPKPDAGQGKDWRMNLYDMK